MIMAASLSFPSPQATHRLPSCTARGPTRRTALRCTPSSTPAGPPGTTCRTCTPQGRTCTPQGRTWIQGSPSRRHLPPSTRPSPLRQTTHSIRMTMISIADSSPETSTLTHLASKCTTQRTSLPQLKKVSVRNLNQWLLPGFTTRSPPKRMERESPVGQRGAWAETSASPTGCSIHSTEVLGVTDQCILLKIYEIISNRNNWRKLHVNNIIILNN